MPGARGERGERREVTVHPDRPSACEISPVMEREGEWRVESLLNASVIHTALFETSGMERTREKDSCLTWTECRTQLEPRSSLSLSASAVALSLKEERGAKELRVQLLLSQ